MTALLTVVDVSFTNCSAPNGGGGGVFWIGSPAMYDDAYATPPVDAATFGNATSGNVAAYGADVASNAMALRLAGLSPNAPQ